jgi:hypothetical protein
VVIKKETSAGTDHVGGQPVMVGTGAARETDIVPEKAGQAKKATSGQLQRRAVTAAKDIPTAFAKGRSVYSVPPSETGNDISLNVRERQKSVSAAPSLIDDAFRKAKSSVRPVAKGMDNNTPTDVLPFDKPDAPDVPPKEADTQVEATPQMRPPMKRRRPRRVEAIHPTIENDGHPTRNRSHATTKTAHTEAERPKSRIDMNSRTESRINSDDQN